MPRSLPALRVASTLAAAAVVATSPAVAQPAFGDRFDGDVGVAAFARTEVVRGSGGSVRVLPYVYGDWGRAFARIDTFGVKTLPLGRGHLELVVRIAPEGVEADAPSLRGVGDRRDPLPIGVGTLQRTPIGAFFAYAMHDLTSGGAFLEGTWAGRLEAGAFTLYPLLGVEVRTGAYVRHLYGIDAAQSAASGYATYRPGTSVVPMAGVAASMPIAGDWSLQLQWRHRRLDGAIADSPIVGRRSVDSGYAGISYAFR